MKQDLVLHWQPPALPVWLMSKERIGYNSVHNAALWRPASSLQGRKEHQDDAFLDSFQEQELEHV
jgi:hypothetical protein